MPCNAHNHSWDCECGWGGRWHGTYGSGGGRVRPRAEEVYAPARPAERLERRLARGDLHSITIPNARCPVCGASVFYYHNAFGSRVFFDELGPPWPKHPCTDNRPVAYAQRTITSPRVSDPKHRAGWLVRGWAPYRPIRANALGGRSVVLKSLGGPGYLEIPGQVFENALGPVFVKVEGGELSASFFDTRAMASCTVGPVRYRRLRPAAKTGFARHVEIEKELWLRLAWRDQAAAALARMARLPRR